MTIIYQLSRADAFNDGDLMPIYSQEDGDARALPRSVLLEMLEANLSRGTLSTRYSAPSATGFSVNAESNTHLILTPLAGYAAGTIVLPSAPTDRDEFLCNCTQSVSTLTVNGNGKTVTGAPTALTANAFFRLKYDGVLSTWYCVG
jgi:hypothetical protein